jgi:hypothetical protein
MIRESLRNNFPAIIVSCRMCRTLEELEFRRRISSRRELKRGQDVRRADMLRVPEGMVERISLRMEVIREGL